MISVSQVPQLFIILRRYLLRVSKESNLQHAFTRILQRLILLGYALRAKWHLWRKGTGLGALSKKGQVESRCSADRSEQAKRERLLLSDTSNGEIVSFEDVAFSLYPSSFSTINNRSSTSWGQLRAQSELSEFEARSTSTTVEITEVTSRQEINTVSSMQILSQVASISYLKHARIKPVMPEGSRRRFRGEALIDQTETAGKIRPLTTNFEKSVPPPGWTRHTHPEGARYFSNQEKRVYTDADLNDHTIFKQALEDISTLEEFISNNNLSLPKNSDLVINLFYDEKNLVIQTTYYFVHHPSRSIFFLDTFQADNLAAWYKIKGVKSDTQLRDEIEAQYWLYLQLYPHAGKISNSLVYELRDWALHFIGENMNMASETGSSISTFTSEDLYKILVLTDNLEKNIGHEHTAGAINLLSRLMHTFAHARLYNFHEKAPADITSEVTSGAQSNMNQRTWLIKVTSPFFFSAPNFYLSNLREMGLGIPSRASVRGRVAKKLIDDWREFILFAILLLIVNVAFLGIQSVDIHHIPHRSPAQISSYLSAVFSIGSIVVGLLLVAHIKMKIRAIAGDGEKYDHYSRISLELRAILYGLPYVLLMWGMVAFVVAFSFLCFQHSSKLTRILVGTLGAAVAILVLWCIWTSWGDNPEYEPVESATDSQVEPENRFRVATKREQVAGPTLLSRLSSLPASLTIHGQPSDHPTTAV